MLLPTGFKKLAAIPGPTMTAPPKLWRMTLRDRPGVASSVRSSWWTCILSRALRSASSTCGGKGLFRCCYYCFAFASSLFLLIALFLVGKGLLHTRSRRLGNHTKCTPPLMVHPLQLPNLG